MATNERDSEDGVSSTPSAALTADRHDCGSPLYRLNDGRLFCVGCQTAEQEGSA